MRKGNTFTCLTAGIVLALMAGACGGPADDVPPADETVTPATPAPDAPVTDPTATPTTTVPAPDAAQAGGPDPALVSQGQQAYATSVCGSCHGPAGDGTPLAPAFTDDEYLWVQPGPNMLAETAALIKTGVPTPKDPAHVAPMPPYGGVPLSDDQVNALAAYVVSMGG
jgi:mono/diheme cytochrome c family protein